MKKYNLFLFVALIFFIMPIKANAYDPTNSGIEYTEFQDYFYTNSSKMTDIPDEVQEAWEKLGNTKLLFDRERTTIYYTYGVPLKDRITDDNVYFDARYVMANTARYIGETSYGYAEKPGRIYLYSDVKSPGTVIHEYGHALYDIYSYRVGYKNKFREKWQKIYEDNKKSLSEFDKVSSENVLINEYEGFAEAFRIYIYDPEQLSKSCREVYSFVNDISSQANSFRYSR